MARASLLSHWSCVFTVRPCPRAAPHSACPAPSRESAARGKAPGDTGPSRRPLSLSHQALSVHSIDCLAPRFRLTPCENGVCCAAQAINRSPGDARPGPKLRSAICVAANSRNANRQLCDGRLDKYARVPPISALLFFSKRVNFLSCVLLFFLFFFPPLSGLVPLILLYLNSIPNNRGRSTYRNTQLSLLNQTIKQPNQPTSIISRTRNHNFYTQLLQQSQRLSISLARTIERIFNIIIPISTERST